MSEGAREQNIGHSKRPLPDGWGWVRLGEVCIKDRQIIKPGSVLAARLPYLGLEHVESNTGRILRHPAEVVEEEGTSTTFAFDERHVLYGKLRPYLNKVALPDSPGRCTTEMIPLLPRANIDRGYLCWTLRRQETVENAMRCKTGSRMPRADMDELLRLLIPLPPLPEQQRIAAILNEQTAAVERARAAAEARLEAAKVLPAAYLRCVFPGPGEALPAGWQWVRILDIADKLPTGVQYERLTCQPEGNVPVVDQSEDDYIGFHNSEPGVLASEDQPVVTFANHTCAVRLHTTPFSTIQNVFPLRGKAGTDTHFLYWLLKNRITASFYGGHWPKLEKEDLPLPPGNEQYRIADRLSRQMALVKRAHKALEEELATIRVLPAALLRRAFSGEL